MDRRSYLGGLVLLLAACGTPKPDSPVDTAHKTGVEDSAPPVDADADGFDAITDCDDTNASIHPGASDPCDGVDQDCDGVGYAEGSCSEVVDLGVGAGAWEADDISTHIVLLSASTDFDGDEIPDPLLSTSCVLVGDTWSCWTGAAVISGGMPDEGTLISTTTLGHWAGEPDTDLLANGGSTGDFDGDGYADIYFTSIGCDGTSQGSVYLIRGPSDRWSSVPLYIGDAADARWLEDRPYVCFGEDADAGRDLDGDGMDEIITSNGDRPVRVHVLRGRADASGTLAAEDELWFDRSGTGSTLLLPDMDGDGLEELGALLADTVTGQGVLGWANEPMTHLPGTDLSSILTVRGSSAGTNYAFMPRGAMGDWNADGYQDVLIGIGVAATEAESGRVCVAPLGGGADLGSDFSDSLGPEICPDAPGVTTVSGVAPVPDVDADGRMEILWGTLDLGDVYGACVIPSSRLPSSGHVAFRERSYCFNGGEDSPGLNALADLDGDGLPEFLLNDTRWEGDTGSRYGRVLVAPGFQIPWDDPSAW
jgi:hypothetical protein